MPLSGKGYFIWRIINCEGGDPQAIANTAQAAGLTHVLIKIADGTYSYNVDSATGVDRALPLVLALRERGIQPWGWHYVYGDDPVGEARKAIARVKGLNLDGYVIDAEAEYKKDKKAAAVRFMSELRASLPNFPIALSSYRFPSYHPAIPWREFLERCDFSMPQVYWEQAHNPDVQLERCVAEYKALTPYRPVIPTGSTYKRGTWTPTEEDILKFLNKAVDLGLTAANLYSWDDGRRYLPELWDTVAAFQWPGTQPGVDLLTQLFQALNARDAARVAALYASNAVHITSARTVQGSEAVRAWYQTLLNQILPGARFTMTSSSGTSTSRTFTWQATSNAGRVLNGNDTLGIANGRISYHYTHFTVTM